MIHSPVLLQETIEFLLHDLSGNYFDGTIGFGGHASSLLLKLGKDAKLIGTDKDVRAFEYSQKKFEDDARVQIYNTSFTNITTISKLESINTYSGILADLGVSSYQLDSGEAGFSYQKNTELDLRMNKESNFPAHHYLNELNENELAKIFFEYGEEKFSRKIAKNIVSARSEKYIKTTFELRQIIERSIGGRHLNKTLSRIFQALRIFVNNELDELTDFLKKSVELLKPGGRLLVISFHSLEDRIVKDYFKYESQECVCPPGTPICICGKKKRLKIITKKPLTASEEELKLNPRSRSAKLRAAEKL